MKPQVKLIGTDGNAFAIMGQVKKAMNRFYENRREADKHFEKYKEEATAGDYENLLQVTLKYCEVI